MALKDRSIHTHAEWSGRTDQPNDPGEGDGNAPTRRSKTGILGRSIAKDIILDQHFAIESNKARSSTDTMVRQRTDLQ